jgi:hypothetical protein
VCGLAIAGAGVDARIVDAFAPAVVEAAARAPRALRVHEATAAFFREFLSTPFDVRCSSGPPVRLTLAEVTERPATGEIEQFSLIFSAPPDTGLGDGIHRLEHERLGAINLFIAPVDAPEAHRRLYQACFGRLVAAPAVLSPERLDGGERHSWRT